MKSDFSQALWQHLHYSTGATCKAGPVANLHVLACPRMSRVGQGVAPAEGEGGSAV